MSNSLEHNNAFHFVKRLAKIAGPDYRVFSTSELVANQCVLDVRLKTIEIGEGTDILTAVGAILFQVGHLRLRSDKRFKEHFGSIESFKDEDILIKKLSRQGAIADKLALDWAMTVMTSNWHLHPSKSRELIQPYIWSEKEWEEYYIKNT